jgi:hypothetical protein
MSSTATTTQNAAAHVRGLPPALFGECLGKVVRLSAHDVSEIMEHQAATRRKFGEIALAWGLCRPQHVWQAWWDQLSRHTPTVDLEKLGIDSQAIASAPAAVAYQFHAVPVRAHQDQLVIATTTATLRRAQEELPKLLNKQVRFVVVSDPAQIEKAIAAYYGKTAGI